MSVTVFPAPSSGGSGGKYYTDVIKSTQSWTCPAGVTSVEVLLVGGGGSGSFASYNQTAGGSGSVLYSQLTVTPGVSYTVTIGAGGAGSSATDGGNDGNTSSFGALLSCPGGNQGSIYGTNPGKGLGASAGSYGGQTGFQGFGSSGGGKAPGAIGNQGTTGGNGAGNGFNFVTAGAANSGAGGGTGNTSATSGAGGSGICIIRYSA